MTQKEILKESLAKLEAQKAALFSSSKAAKSAELQADFNNYVKEQEAKYNESLVALKHNLDAAIQAKREEVNAVAEKFAMTETAKVDQTIAALQTLIDVVE